MSTSETILTTVTAAEETLSRLQTKRGTIVARVKAISEQRKQLGFSVHVGDDKQARKQLDELNREATTIDGELESLDAAIGEGQRRLEAAQRELARREDFENAKRIKKTFAHLVKLAQAADEHLTAFGEISSAIRRDVQELHSFGQAMPTDQQMQTFCALATSSVLMFLPWARQMEARHLAPSERRNFSRLFGDWYAAAMRNLEARVGNFENGGEQPKQEADHASA
jgi:archaellum component FlaC